MTYGSRTQEMSTPVAMATAQPLGTSRDPHVLRASGPRGAPKYGLARTVLHFLRPQGATSFSVKQQRASEPLARAALHTAMPPTALQASPGSGLRLLPRTRDYGADGQLRAHTDTHRLGRERVTFVGNRVP